MKVGVFDHLDRNDRPLHAFYEERLTIVEAYDRGGFYAYHTAEHHATPLGLAASPSVFSCRRRAAHAAPALRSPRLHASAPPSPASGRGNLHARPAQQGPLRVGRRPRHL